MGQQTNISYVDGTFNGWIGCTKVSAGCKNCYAEKSLPARFRNIKWGPSEERVRASDTNWQKPKTWNRQHELFAECENCGWRGRVTQLDCPDCGETYNYNHTVRQRILCGSLCDVLEDNPQVIEWRDELFRLAGKTPNLDWFFLTKRIENVVPMLPDRWANGGLPRNIRFGVTAENQKMLNRRWPHMERLVRYYNPEVIFLSLEPLLGEINLTIPLTEELDVGNNESVWWTRTVDWVIVGGESGPDARPMDLDWARSIIEQCREAEIPVFFKQAGSAYAKRYGLKDRKGADLKELPPDLHVREFPE